MHQCIKLFYFGMTLHMFRTVFPPIIRSSRLYIQQQAFARRQYLFDSCMYSLELQQQAFVKQTAVFSKGKKIICDELEGMCWCASLACAVATVMV